MNLNTFFGPNRKIVKAVAPGRLDVMGGIADYSGSLLLQMPIRESTIAYIAKRKDGLLRMFSSLAQSEGIKAEVTIPILNWPSVKNLLDPDFILSLREEADHPWALYVVGCFITSLSHKKYAFEGADVYIQSDIPLGKGVSSSAALEIAVLSGINYLYRLKLDKIQLPLLGQQAENRVVGAPCGLMDQLSSYLGREDHLLPIICQPAKVFGPVPIPEDLQFIGIDSGVKHRVSGRQYSRARTAAFMGYSIILQHLGISREFMENADTEALPFQGYLANIEKVQFQEDFQQLLPVSMPGEEFLRRYGSVIDPVTNIHPEEKYPIRACTAHPVFENDRINLFMQALKQVNQNNENRHLFKQMGLWMYESHQGYSDCGLGRQQTDFLVENLKSMGADKGIYGARISGGGCGGTVVVMLEKKQSSAAIQRILKDYQAKYGISSHLFMGSSMGAYYSHPEFIS